MKKIIFIPFLFLITVLGNAQVTMEGAGIINIAGSTPVINFLNTADEVRGGLRYDLDAFTPGPMVLENKQPSSILIENETANSIVFRTNNKHRLTVTGGGDVGIGTPFPAARLHVIGTSENDSAIRVETGNITNGSDNKPGLYMQKLDGVFAGAIYGDVANETSGTEGGIDLRLEADDDINFTTGNNPNNSRMHIAQDGKIVFNNQYGFPLLDGQENQLLVTDGVGNLTWKSFSGEEKKYYTIGASSFRPARIASYHQNGAGGSIISEVGGVQTVYYDNGVSNVGTNILYASVSLPDGASILSMKVYFVDNSSSNLSVSLNRWRIDTYSGFLSIANVKSSGVNGSSSIIVRDDNTISANAATVDNSAYTYYILASCEDGNWAGSNLGIRAVIIEYESSSFTNSSAPHPTKSIMIDSEGTGINDHPNDLKQPSAIQERSELTSDKPVIYPPTTIEQQQQLNEKNDEIQDLNAKINNLTKENETIHAQIKSLETSLIELSSLVKNLNTKNTQLFFDKQDAAPNEDNLFITLPLETPQLQQNFPNPFNQQTEIQYYLPTSVQTAQIHITDLQGKTLKTYNLNEKGIGKVTLNGGQLASGTYAYTLIIDGQIVDTKQMVLTK